MGRAFFLEVTDLVVGFLPPSLRGFQQQTFGSSSRIWYDEPHVHFEVQRISQTALRSAGVKGMREALEVGLHAEFPQNQRNDEVIQALLAHEKRWRRALGRDPVAGPFVGRREHATRWRRISELWDVADLDGEEVAVEAADRLAAYVRALHPLLGDATRPGPGSAE